MKPNKKLLGKYAAIRYYTGANPDTSILAPASFVHFDKKNPEKFFWRGGGWCVINEHTELAEVFKNQPKTYDEVSKLYVDFIKKYHAVSPTEELIQSDGWISPNGEFYTCGNGQHWGLGEAIACCVYDTDESWNWLAESKGWLYLHKDGTTGYNLPTMTKSMFEKIDKLSKVGNERWNRHLDYLCIEYENKLT